MPIEARPNNFVEPEQMQLLGSYPSELLVVFCFKGEVRKDRRIEIAIEAVRNDGRIIVRTRRICRDQRMTVQDHRDVQLGTLISSSDVRNHELFDIAENSVGSIDRIDLTFREL